MGALRTFLAAAIWTVVAPIEEKLRPARKLINTVVALQDRVAELERELTRLGDMDDIAEQRAQAVQAFDAYKYSDMSQLSGCADMPCFACEGEHACRAFQDNRRTGQAVHAFVRTQGELDFARAELRSALAELAGRKPSRGVTSCNSAK